MHSFPKSNHKILLISHKWEHTYNISNTHHFYQSSHQREFKLLPPSCLASIPTTPISEMLRKLTLQILLGKQIGGRFISTQALYLIHVCSSAQLKWHHSHFKTSDKITRLNILARFPVFRGLSFVFWSFCNCMIGSDCIKWHHICQTIRTRSQREGLGTHCCSELHCLTTSNLSNCPQILRPFTFFSNASFKPLKMITDDKEPHSTQSVEFIKSHQL